jgi:hypothetical protein
MSQDRTLKVYNGSGFIITLIPYGQGMRRYDPRIVIHRDKTLRAEIAYIPTDVFLGEAPLYKTVCEKYDECPEGYDFYIVSREYLEATRLLGKPIDKLLTLDNNMPGYYPHIYTYTICMN